MAFSFPKLSFPFFPLFSRDVKGDTFYMINSSPGWSTAGLTNIEIAQDHPILTPAILFLSKLFSQADFYLENKKTKERIYDHWVLKLLSRPNYYQTSLDFLEAEHFTMIAHGYSVIWLRRITGVNEPDAMYLLNPNLIEFPDNFRTKLSNKNMDNPIRNTKVLYDRDGENIQIPFRDLLFIYDLPNGMDTNNCFKAKSRIDGLKQTLINTKDSLLAKNIILKTNGKELITASGAAGDFPLGDNEKQDAEKLFFSNYGLGFNRKRGLITKANLNWQSMHVALRDLGLDESVKVDGNIIYTALHIPKDIMSLEAKKTTYNNFKESMVSFIQNEMQPTLNAFLEPFQPLIEDENWRLAGDYEHMPIMQFILIERYEGIEKRGMALKALRDAGLPDDVCLDLCGFDKKIKLNELMQNMMQNGNQGGEQQGQESEQD